MSGYEDLSLLEMIFTFIIQGLLLSWLIYIAIRYFQHTKSPMYEKVLKNNLEVRLSQLDLKYEYKTAILRFKQEKLRDKHLHSQDLKELNILSDLYLDYVGFGGRISFTEFSRWLPKLDFHKIEQMHMSEIRSIKKEEPASLLYEIETILREDPITKAVDKANNILKPLGIKISSLINHSKMSQDIEQYNNKLYYTATINMVKEVGKHCKDHD